MLRCQSDFFGMRQSMFQVVPAMIILFFLIVSTMPHLLMALAGKSRRTAKEYAASSLAALTTHSDIGIEISTPPSTSLSL